MLREGFLVGGEQCLTIACDAHRCRGDFLADDDDCGWQCVGFFDRESRFVRAVDRDWKDGKSEGAKHAQFCRGDVAGRGIAGVGCARDMDQDAAAIEVSFELLAGRLGCGIGDAEHRAGIGFFQMRANRRIVMSGFLNQPCDPPFGKNAFDLNQLVEIKTPGHHQHSVCGDASFVDDGWSEWHCLTLLSSL